MSDMKRREFLQITLSGVALAALSRCSPAARPGDETSATPTLLRNENREGFYIRYYKPFAPVDPQTWALSVEGLVRHPQTFTYADVQAFPQITQASRMKCVEGWSVAAYWHGFRPQALIDKVLPQEDATWVHFYCADDYYESLELRELTRERVLFVHGMNDDLLLPEYGAPLRLIVPFKYAYKGPKAITRIVFAREELRGYWPTVGPYTTSGHIHPGRDYALDLGEYRNVAEMGEIFYADGIESQELP